jgi:hypothetical protein
MSKGVQLTDDMLAARRQLLVNLVPIMTDGGDGFAVAGTGAVLDGGGMSLTTGGTANDEASIASVGKLYKNALGASAQARFTVEFTEANTDDAELFIGMSSGAVADQMADSSAGPPSNYSGFGFFKIGGTTTWSVEASNATAQTTQELSASGSLTGSAQVSGSRQTLGIDVISKTATTLDVVFSIDEVAVYKVTDFDATSLAAMYLMAVIKSSSANAEALKLYNLQFAQVIAGLG